jgi:Zn-dependent protease with chaperone function
MKRRALLRWGCAHCAVLGGAAWAQAQPELPNGDWAAPARFARPELGSDEGGLWALMDREETRLRRSPFRMREEPLAGYLTALACKLGGEHCADVRVYPVRTPYFNASMAPNGMMQVWSGLLLRVENEAQLAAVVGHEIGHYLRRHTLEMLRDLKSRSAFGAFLGLFGVVGLIGQIASIAGLMAFSRDNEREADRISVALLKKAGYDPREAGKVWGNLLDELKATPGADLGKDSVLFASHPPSDERRQTLESLAAGSQGRTGEAEYRAVLAPLRHGLLEDEIKRGRPHESVALISRLLDREAQSAELMYFRGEALLRRAQDGDSDLAMIDFQAALATGKAPAPTHRALGHLHKARNDIAATREAWQRYLDQAPGAPDAALIRQSLEELKT